MHWLLCGLEPADVIVSEFRINESNANHLEWWYHLARRYAQHIVILDLWSWLNPPQTGRPPATVQALLNLKKRFPDINQTQFSILSLSDRDVSVWREKVASFFNYSGTARPIPQKCYDSVISRNVTPPECRNYGGEMQHGQGAYHMDVGASLAKHMKDHVLPLVSPGRKTLVEQTALCIGGWGKERKRVLPWNTSLVGETNFQFRNPFSSRVDKVTLNTNSALSKLRLDCPTPYNSSMRIGFISHSDLKESCLFEVNGVNVSTHDATNWKAGIRTRQYTDESFSPPVDISVLTLQPGAYLELTDIVCKRD
jgi:hypothetical protein